MQNEVVPGFVNMRKPPAALSDALRDSQSTLAAGAPIAAETAGFIRSDGSTMTADAPDAD